MKCAYFLVVVCCLLPCLVFLERARLYARASSNVGGGTPLSDRILFAFFATLDGAHLSSTVEIDACDRISPTQTLVPGYPRSQNRVFLCCSSVANRWNFMSIMTSKMGAMPNGSSLFTLPPNAHSSCNMSTLAPLRMHQDMTELVPVHRAFKSTGVPSD